MKTIIDLLCFETLLCQLSFQAHFSKTALVASHRSNCNSSIMRYTNGRNFCISLPTPTPQDRRRLFTLALGNHFDPFEIEVGFHLRRLVAASCAIGDLVNDNDEKRRFATCEADKIASGLLRARPDAQVTTEDLTRYVCTHKDPFGLGELTI